MTADEVQNDRAIRNAIEKAERFGIRTLFVVLPRKDNILYARIKYWADKEYGVNTICVVESRKKWVSAAYWANVALKFNLKHGGINHSVPSPHLGCLQRESTMILGIDVTHPAPGSPPHTPSIAGVVASISKDYVKWPVSLRTQEPRKEMVTNLAEIMIERLDEYQKHNNGEYPKNILIYRDGKL